MANDGTGAINGQLADQLYGRFGGQFVTGGNDLALLAVVPEPRAWALVGCGALLLLILKRRAERVSRK